MGYSKWLYNHSNYVIKYRLYFSFYLFYEISGTIKASVLH